MTTVKLREIELGERKLLSSGLTLEDGENLGMELLCADETQALHPAFKRLCSLKINYYGIDGLPIEDWPNGGPFFRLRYLETPVDFASIVGEAPRYVQMPNTAPVAYYPKIVDWTTIAQERHPAPMTPLIITEGELKAAKACRAGFPTIGIGGVWNWRSNRLGLMWLPSLDLVNWVRRHVYICFDSDYRTNPQVCLALHEFAQELQRRGAFVYLISLPALQGLEKTGLDDFLVHAGATAPGQLRELLEQAEPLGLSAPLWELNKRFLYVSNPGLILDTISGQKIAPAMFKEHHQSTAVYQERHLRTNGTVSYKPVSASATWIKWPLRREAAALTYVPGGKQFIDVPKGSGRYYNLWPGLAVEPSPGDVTPFLELVAHMFSGTPEEEIKWFHRWLAYPLQYPGTKLFTAVLVHGIIHGTGKSLIGYTMKEIYGLNFTKITAAELHGNFNEWAENKQFILGDDVMGSEKRQHADALKILITQQEMRINAKFIPTYIIPDCINYYFTSNHPDAFVLEDHDRRYAIFRVVVEPLPSKFYLSYMKWLKADGASHLLQYFYDLDLGDFNPAAPAIKTEAKEEMIALNKTDLAEWVHTLIINPDTVLRQGEMKITKDLFTSKELLHMYDPLGRTKVTANGIARELAKSGVRPVYQGRPLRIPTTGEQARYYPLRNADHWTDASSGQLVAHLVEWMERQGEKVRKY